MTPCTCPLAGYCDRHQTEKNEHWHRLCQTHFGYYDAWERGRGPGQVRSVEEREARRERVLAAAAQKNQLIGWLKLLGYLHPTDLGIGDTAARVLKQRKKSRAWIADDARHAVNCLLKQCSCSRKDAVERLNQQYPY